MSSYMGWVISNRKQRVLLSDFSVFYCNWWCISWFILLNCRFWLYLDTRFRSRITSSRHVSCSAFNADDSWFFFNVKSVFNKFNFHVIWKFLDGIPPFMKHISFRFSLFLNLRNYVSSSNNWRFNSCVFYEWTLKQFRPMSLSVNVVLDWQRNMIIIYVMHILPINQTLFLRNFRCRSYYNKILQFINHINILNFWKTIVFSYFNWLRRLYSFQARSIIYLNLDVLFLLNRYFIDAVWLRLDRDWTERAYIDICLDVFPWLLCWLHI